MFVNGFTEINCPKQRVVDGNAFPLCITASEILEGENKGVAKEDVIRNIQEQREVFDNLLRHHRAILFRGCGIHTPQDFHEFIEATGLDGMDYIGGAAVRTQITSRVFTANESPSSERIPFHHEMAQTPNPPTHLFFFCEVPPVVGGETPILVSSEMYDIIHTRQSAFMDAVEKYGIRYVRFLSEDDDPTSAIGRGWKSTFLTNTREGAEEALRQLGSSWEWLPNGTLKTVTAIIPGVRIDEGIGRSNQKTFFNSIVAAFTGWNDSRNVGDRAVILGDDDGTLCDPVAILDATNVMEEISVSIPWESGDVMLLDNRTTMHSRKPFEGPRRILVGLARNGTR